MRFALLLCIVGSVPSAGCAGQAGSAGPRSQNPAPASTVAPGSAGDAAVVASPTLAARADDLVRMINGEVAPGALFTSKVLEEMSPNRLLALSKQLRSRRGKALGVNRIEAITSQIGIVFIDFERAQLPLRIKVADEPPHLIAGLQTLGPQ